MLDFSETAGRRHTPAAFTLVELLVVITIIGMLTAIFMPAVGQVRETGRRLRCTNNMQQIFKATASYEAATQKLPPSGKYADVSGLAPVDLKSGTMLSWLVLILPYLDEKPLYDQIDQSRSAFDQPTDVLATSLSVLSCASDAAQGRMFNHPTLTKGRALAKGNYAAYVSPFHPDLQLEYPGAMICTGQRDADIRDGRSNTLMFSEVRTRPLTSDQRGAWALAWTGATILTFDMHADYSASLGQFVGSPYSVGVTQPPNCEGPNVDMLYDCQDTAGAQLDRMPCGTWRPGTGWEYLSSAPRSLHPGGVGVVFADGHYRFMANQIDDYVMAYLISVNDGKAIDMTPYFP